MKKVRVSIMYSDEEIFEFDDNATEEEIADYIWDYVESDVVPNIYISWEEEEED